MLKPGKTMTKAMTSPPTFLARLPATRFVELDVRPILQSGGEPFSRIMETVERMPPGHVLRLRATFKPVPLLGVMHQKGWAHWIAHGQDEDWEIWFYRLADFEGSG